MGNIINYKNPKILRKKVGMFHKKVGTGSVPTPEGSYARPVLDEG